MPKKQQHKLYEILDQLRADARGNVLDLAALDSVENTLVQSGVDIKAVRSQKHWHEDTQLINVLITQWHFVATPELKRRIVRDEKRHALLGVFSTLIAIAD